MMSILDMSCHSYLRGFLFGSLSGIIVIDSVFIQKFFSRSLFSIIVKILDHWSLQLVEGAILHWERLLQVAEATAL